MELGIAYLDIRDMIRDKGFWVGGASGEEANGILGFIEPGWLIGVELELLGGSEGPAKEKKIKLISQENIYSNKDHTADVPPLSWVWTDLSLWNYFLHCPLPSHCLEHLDLEETF